MKQALYAFLDKHNVKNSYVVLLVNNIRRIKVFKDVDDFFRRMIPERFLSSAFTWELSPQRFDFWKNLHKEWVKLLEEY